MYHWYVSIEGATMSTAKLFWTGRSQAIRLPKEFRFEGDEVSIRREGNAIVIEPIVSGWEWLDDLTGTLDADFEAALAEKVPQQDRPELDDLFK
jgi:antitoxin VapB